MKGKSKLVLVAGIVCLIISSIVIQANWAAEKPRDYPNRPIIIMVAAPAGGPLDIAGRILAEPLKKVVGQRILIENKPGAAQQIGLTDFAVNAKPDGYNIAYISVPQTQTIVFDPIRKAAFTMEDFQPLVNHVQDPNAIFVRKDSPFKTVDDLLSAVKANPGQISISTSGIGSDDHLAVLEFQRKGSLKFNIVHMRGTGEAMVAAIGGHLDVIMDNIGGFMNQVKAGEGRILAVAMEKRFPDLPDVPTFRDKGIDLIASSSRGFVMPAKTPKEIVKYLEQAFKKAIDDPDHTKRMKDAGLTLQFMDIEKYSRFIEAENNRAKELIKLYR